MPTPLREHVEVKKKKKKKTNTYRLGILEKALVDLVHSRKIPHVGQEDIHLHHVLETRATRGEDGAQVIEDLFLKKSP